MTCTLSSAAWIRPPSTWARRTLPSGSRYAAAGLAGQVYVAGVVLPAVSVAGNRNLVAQFTHSPGQGGVHVAVFAYEQYLHL